jgi:chromosome segregation ATPase
LEREKQASIQALEDIEKQVQMYMDAEDYMHTQLKERAQQIQTLRDEAMHSNDTIRQLQTDAAAAKLTADEHLRYIAELRARLHGLQQDLDIATQTHAQDVAAATERQRQEMDAAMQEKHLVIAAQAQVHMPLPCPNPPPLLALTLLRQMTMRLQLILRNQQENASLRELLDVEKEGQSGAAHSNSLLEAHVRGLERDLVLKQSGVDEFSARLDAMACQRDEMAAQRDEAIARLADVSARLAKAGEMCVGLEVEAMEQARLLEKVGHVPAQLISTLQHTIRTIKQVKTLPCMCCAIHVLCLVLFCQALRHYSSQRFV